MNISNGQRLHKTAEREDAQRNYILTIKSQSRVNRAEAEVRIANDATMTREVEDQHIARR